MNAFRRPALVRGDPSDEAGGQQVKRYHLSIDNVLGSSDLPEGAVQPQGISLAIGFFDGVHLGHLEVVRHAVELAKEQRLVPAVLTFVPHPRAVLGKGAEFESVLTPLEEKLELLAKAGIEAAYLVQFDVAFSQVTPQTFVERLIVPIGTKAAVVGFDFRFGHRGQGDAEALRTFGGGEIEVKVVPPVIMDGEKVSSTRIRDRLAAGECEQASLLLGHPYVIEGIVVHGDARGRQIGFPTANVLPEQPFVIPRVGVYAIHVDVVADDGGKTRHHAVLNVGYRPTFDSPGGSVKLEAHLFDFEGDLYGRKLAITFLSFLRPEKKFSGIEELIEQIRNDSIEARQIVAENGTK
jgi:riboflavin kinase / FMN adenylyltransferase